MHGILSSFKINNSKINGPSSAPSILLAGTTPVALCAVRSVTKNSDYTVSSNTLTIKAAGTYRFYTAVELKYGSESATAYCRIYINGAAAGVEHTGSGVFYDDLAANVDDVVTVYQHSDGTYYAYNPFLAACILWDNGF
jgi:hypothetical protein